MINSDSSVSVLGDSGVGTYDGSDDTLIGIVNRSSKSVNAVTVTGPGSGLSQFDGDGICSSPFLPWSGSASCPYGPSGYEGPGTSFTTDPSLPDSAEVDFGGGIAPGGSTYFGLEGALTSADITAREGKLECANPVLSPTGAVDYCIPGDWDAKTAADTLPVHRGVEPLNLILSAQSTVTLDQILTILGKYGLRGWTGVGIGTTLAGARSGNCISEEDANIAGSYGPQAFSWRDGGCFGGAGWLALLGFENHARLWPQQITLAGTRGATQTAWFISASFEELCGLWHCITPDGYDRGALSLTSNISNAARSQGWKVTSRLDKRTAGVGGDGVHSGPGTGLSRVAYSGSVEVLTITT